MSIQGLNTDYFLNSYLYLNGFNAEFAGVYELVSEIVWGVFSVAAIACVFLLIRKGLSIRASMVEKKVLLEITPSLLNEKTNLATQELFKTIHQLMGERSFEDKLLGKKAILSFEIVSSQKEGIRYLIRIAPNQVGSLRKILTSYMPEASIKIVNEYLPKKLNEEGRQCFRIVEFKLAKHFAYPLQKQKEFEGQDAVAYITGAMTKLSLDEIIALQISLLPVEVRETSFIKHKILRGEDVLGYINELSSSGLWMVFKFPLAVGWKIFFGIGEVLRTVVSDFMTARGTDRLRYNLQASYPENNRRPARTLTQFEQEIVRSIEEKIDQSLFETRIRLLVRLGSKDELNHRIRGVSSALNIFSSAAQQKLIKKWSLVLGILDWLQLLNFKKPVLDLVFGSSTILSVSEVADSGLSDEEIWQKIDTY